MNPIKNGGWVSLVFLESNTRHMNIKERENRVYIVSTRQRLRLLLMGWRTEITPESIQLQKDDKVRQETKIF